MSFSCADRYDFAPDEKSPELYDRVGFEVGKAPQNSGANSPISKVAPDYYYRQPAYPQVQNYAPQQQMPQAYQQLPYAQHPYQQAQPYYQQQSQAYYRPQQADTGSRFYANPYAIPSAPPQANRYDADQFYVPPTYQNNPEAAQPIQNNRAVTY